MGSRKPVSPEIKIQRSAMRLWVHDIRNLYYNGMIGSEQHLQAEFFHLLRKRLPEKNGYHIHASPILSIPDITPPDVVITHGDSVLAVARFKFIPHGFPRYEHVLQQFERLRRYSGKNILSRINPQNGLPGIPVYHLHPDCLFIFAAIAQYNAEAFNDKHWKKFDAKKLLLIGRIDNNEQKLFEVEPEFGAQRY